MASLVEIRRKDGPLRRDLRAFLPTSREEMEARGWDALDILIINGTPTSTIRRSVGR
jgi:hypothetical protein